jgi:hypothetical protein
MLALDKYSATNPTNYVLTFNNWFKLDGNGITINQQVFPYPSRMRSPKAAIDLFNQHPEHIKWLVNRLVVKTNHGIPTLAQNGHAILTAIVNYVGRLRASNKSKLKNIESIQDVMSGVEERFGSN